MNRRRFQVGMLAATTFALVHRAGFADKPVRLVIGFPPGGSLDALARALADSMRERLGRAVVVENRPGANGRLAVEQVRQAQADGDTLMLVPHGPMTLFPHVYRNLRYDPVKDFTPIARVATFDYALLASNAVPAEDAVGLRKWIQASERNSSYASPGAGSVPHFLGLSVAQNLGVPMTQVSYRGASQVLTDIAGGVIPFGYATVPTAADLAAAGKLKILAVSGPRRAVELPQVPTLKEIGIDVELSGWFAVYGPAGMKAQTVETIRQSLDAAARSAAIREQLETQRLAIEVSTPQELARLQVDEQDFWQRVVKASGFTPGE